MTGVLKLEIEKDSFSKAPWLMDLLRKTSLSYSYTATATEKDIYLINLRKYFIHICSQHILSTFIDHHLIVELFTKPIFNGEIVTLLDRLCLALYRKYIEQKDDIVQVIIGKKYLAKLNVSPADIIKYSKIISPLLGNFMDMRVYINGEKIVIDLALLLEE